MVTAMAGTLASHDAGRDDDPSAGGPMPPFKMDGAVASVWTFTD